MLKAFSTFVLLALSHIPTVSSASVERRTEDANANFQYDLSAFSLRFDKCQYVKTFDDELAEEEDAETVLALKHFVVFSLCPSDKCNSQCDSGVHGVYVEDIEDYLGATVEFEQEAFEYMCDNCNEYCSGDNTCTGCGQICYEWATKEAAGYVDASNFVECQRVDIQNDDDGRDDDAEDVEVYIGPRCSSDGSKITISLFTDENCAEPYDAMDVEEALGYPLSYHILSSIVSSENNECISCAENDENNANDQADEDNVNEMCEELYNSAGKCETKYGIDGFLNDAEEEDRYENQEQNEFKVCTFIDSLKWNSYTETGEINIVDEQDEVIRVVDTVQTVAFSVLALAVIGLFAYGYYLHRTIEKLTEKVDLSAQGDGQMS